MSNTKNLQPKEGYKNRHIDGVPDKETVIEVITKDIKGTHRDVCLWKPFNKDDYALKDMPSAGYLGTAKVTIGRWEGIDFHAWQQNNSEFIYYKEINLKEDKSSKPEINSDGEVVEHYDGRMGHDPTYG